MQCIAMTERETKWTLEDFMKQCLMIPVSVGLKGTFEDSSGRQILRTSTPNPASYDLSDTMEQSYAFQATVCNIKENGDFLKSN